MRLRSEGYYWLRIFSCFEKRQMGPLTDRLRRANLVSSLLFSIYCSPTSEYWFLISAHCDRFLVATTTIRTGITDIPYYRKQLFMING